MSSSDFYFQSFKFRESELRHLAEQHRLLVEAGQGAEAAAESDGSRNRKGGGSPFHFRSARRSQRASAPSAC